MYPKASKLKSCQSLRLHLSDFDPLLRSLRSPVSKKSDIKRRSSSQRLNDKTHSLGYLNQLQKNKALTRSQEKKSVVLHFFKAASNL